MTTAVVLATEDDEFGQVPAKKAKAEAQQLADDLGKTVTLHDPVTAKVIGKVKPTKAPKAKAGKAKPTSKAAKLAARRASNEAAIKAADAAKAAKGKTAKGKAPKAKAKPTGKNGAALKAKEPRGMVVEILKLASRPHKGVSPAELNELTKWKGAPWKWLFSNPKGNGYCDRWGYDFQVVKGEDGGVRYLTTKK
jgi:hypothetical protein